MIPRDALPQWIWVTNKDYGQILVYVSDANLYAWGHGTRIEFISGTHLDVTESLDEIAVKLGAQSSVAGDVAEVLEKERRHVLRDSDRVLWFRDFARARIFRVGHFFRSVVRATYRRPPGANWTAARVRRPR